jgi:hypothetical protein
MCAYMSVHTGACIKIAESKFSRIGDSRISRIGRIKVMMSTADEGHDTRRLILIRSF